MSKEATRKIDVQKLETISRHKYDRGIQIVQQSLSFERIDVVFLGAAYDVQVSGAMKHMKQHNEAIKMNQ